MASSVRAPRASADAGGGVPAHGRVGDAASGGGWTDGLLWLGLIAAVALAFWTGRTIVLTPEDMGLAVRAGLGGSLFAGVHGEPSSVVVVVARVLQDVVGLEATAWILKLVALLALLAASWLLARLVRPLVGGGVATGLGVVLAFSGAGLATVLTPVGAGPVVALALGLAAVALAWRGSVVVAAVLLFVAAGCGWAGLAIAVGLAVSLLARGDAWRAVAPLAAALVLPVLGVLAQHGSLLSGSRVPEVPVSAFDGAAAAVGAAVGLDDDWGRVLVALLAIGAVALAARAVRPPAVAAGALAGLLVLLLALAVAPGVEAEAVDVGVAGIAGVLLLGVGLVDGLRTAWPAAPARPVVAWRLPLAVAAGVLLVLAVCLTGADDVRDRSREPERASAELAAALAAVTLAGPRLAADEPVAPALGPGISAGTWRALEADDGQGSALSLGDLPGAGGGPRYAADDVLLRAREVVVEPEDSTPAGLTGPNLEPGVVATRAGGCVTARHLELELPTGGLRVRSSASVDVQARRFGTVLRDLDSGLPANRTRTVRAVPDVLADAPWHVAFDSDAPVTACALAG